VGDVVVGRITAVESSRWRVDINSTLDGVLPLTSVNLPGGELVGFFLISLTCTVLFEKSYFVCLQRRRSEEDERMMRHYFVENDLISVPFLFKFHNVYFQF